MLISLLRYWPLLSTALILVLFAGSFFIPDQANIIAGIVVILSLSVAVYSVVQKNFRVYRNKPVSKIAMLRNILLELSGILLAMLLAGSIGKYAAEMLTGQIGDEVAKLIVGIVIGMSIGLGIGVILRRVWGSLLG